MSDAVKPRDAKDVIAESNANKLTNDERSGAIVSADLTTKLLAAVHPEVGKDLYRALATSTMRPFPAARIDGSTALVSATGPMT